MESIAIKDGRGETLYCAVNPRQICHICSRVRVRVHPSLYTILPLPILYDMHCNQGWPEGNTVMRNSVGDEGGGGGVTQTKGGFGNKSIDSCTKASS